MNVVLTQVARRAVLSVRGRFVFAMRGEFLKCMQEATALRGIDEIEVDLKDSEYLDSAAVGMLLILRDRAEAAGCQRIRISGSSGQVRGVLEMCNLEQLFVMD